MLALGFIPAARGGITRGSRAGACPFVRDAQTGEGTFVFMMPARTSTIPLRSGRAVAVASWIQLGVSTSCPICTSFEGTNSRAELRLGISHFLVFQCPFGQSRERGQHAGRRWSFVTLDVARKLIRQGIRPRSGRSASRSWARRRASSAPARLLDQLITLQRFQGMLSLIAGLFPASP